MIFARSPSLLSLDMVPLDSSVASGPVVAWLPVPDTPAQDTLECGFWGVLALFCGLRPVDVVLERGRYRRRSLLTAVPRLRGLWPDGTWRRLPPQAASATTVSSTSVSSVGAIRRVRNPCKTEDLFMPFIS